MEICIYEVKPDKTEEFEALLNEVVHHHRNFPGVVDVRYSRHRQSDFNAVKEGEPAIKLTRVKNYFWGEN